MDQKFTDEIADALPDIDCPTTVLWGERDGWLPVAQGERLAGLISDRPLIRIPDAGHLVQEDAPEAIVAAMLEQRPET